MILTPVSSVWTSTSSSKDQETELVLEEDANQESELNTESTKKRPWNGSDVNTMVPSTTDKFTYLNNISILIHGFIDFLSLAFRMMILALLPRSVL